MKRVFSSVAPLLGALTALGWSLPAGAEDTPLDTPSETTGSPATDSAPADGASGETPADGSTDVANSEAAAAADASAPAETEAAPQEAPKEDAPLDAEGPPEPEWDPKLEPEVYWEGDSDDHNPGYVPGYGTYQTNGMNPNQPRAGAMPGGITAAPGSDTWSEDWNFQFHGYMEATLRAAYGSREIAAPGQSETTWHATPIVPGRYGDFEATQSVPGPWAQMNFTYGNPYVSATAIIAGFNQQSGASYTYPSSQVGINDVYLTLRLPEMRGLRLKAYAGAFQDRYGAMAQYSEGNYGHSIVAYTRGTGATVVGDFDLFGDVIGLFEVGVKGSLNKAPIGIEPNDANAYADVQNGAGYLAHAHFGVAVGVFDISAHWLGAFAKDDRVPEQLVRPGDTEIPSERPDGSINTFGLTLRAIGEPFGHFFIGGGHTIAENARSVPRVINILNADGGRGLMEEYLGMQSGGNGALTHVGFQYDMSLQKYLKYPAFFPSNAWDLRGSFFATYVHVQSDQASTNLPGFEVKFDDVNKFKIGSELTYNFIEWAGVSFRYDFVGPDLSDGGRSYHILSPRILFRTSWLAHEQINIRYTYWAYGDRVIVQNVAPNDPQGLDEHMIALQANMYW